jgi:hypothetical protein
MAGAKLPTDRLFDLLARNLPRSLRLSSIRPGPCFRPLEITRCSERCMNDEIRLTRHPLQTLAKLASASGGSQANVARNQDVYAKTQAGQPAQDGGADQGAG